MPPCRGIAGTVNRTLDRVQVSRPIIAAAHVVLTRPDHFDRSTSDSCYLNSFRHKVRSGIGAPTEATSQQRGVNLHLLRLEFGNFGCGRAIAGLKLCSRPDFAAIVSQV